MPATPTVEPVSDEPMQGVMPVNEDKPFVAGQPASIAEEPVTLLTRLHNISDWTHLLSLFNPKLFYGGALVLPR